MINKLATFFFTVQISLSYRIDICYVGYGVDIAAPSIIGVVAGTNQAF